ncbi:hypothetical protein AOLI_G00167080 [Acnodon oligacanthus]
MMSSFYGILSAASRASVGTEKATDGPQTCDLQHGSPDLAGKLFKWRLTDTVAVWDELQSFVPFARLRGIASNLASTKAPTGLLTPGQEEKKGDRLSQEHVFNASV